MLEQSIERMRDWILIAKLGGRYLSSLERIYTISSRGARGLNGPRAFRLRAFRLGAFRLGAFRFLGEPSSPNQPRPALAKHAIDTDLAPASSSAVIQALLVAPLV